MSDTPIEDSIKALHYERTRKKEPPPGWPAVEAILNEYGLQAIDFVAAFKAAMKQGEQQPVAKYIGETPYGGSEVQLYEDLKKGTELYAAAPAVQSDDSDLLTIAFMDGYAKGKAAALAQQGEPVAYVKFRNGEVDYDCDDNCVISNTPGDAMTEENAQEHAEALRKINTQIA